jgi:hypothetical protein
MTTDEPRQESECTETPPKDECTECDTKLIDDLKCEAEGVAAEAAYNAEYQKDVTAAQSQFNDIRNKYRSTRTDVALDVHDMSHQTKKVLDRVRCLIKQHRVVECLDESWEEVRCELTSEKCYTSGCCVKPELCKFDVPENVTCETDLTTLITKYIDHAAKAHACFTTLTGEPDALSQRVRDRKAELDDILAKLNGDAATTDLKRLYASALVLRYRLKNIWNGFKEPKDFVDCLCRALTCWTEGSATVAILKHKLAVLQCHDKADADRCTYVKEHTVDEVLTVYEKRCCPDPCPPATDDSDDDDDDDDDECGCGHEKHGASAD